MKIMLIEDDLDMQELLIDYLQNYNYSVDAFDKPVKALEVLKSFNSPRFNATST